MTNSNIISKFFEGHRVEFYLYIFILILPRLIRKGINLDENFDVEIVSL